MSDSRLRTTVVDLASAGERDIASIDEVLEGCPWATVFHTPVWNLLLANEFGLRQLVFMAWEGSTPVGAYPVWLLSDGLCRSPLVERQSCYGGPVVLPEYEERAMTALLRAAERRLPLAVFQIWTAPGCDSGVLCETRLRV